MNTFSIKESIKFGWRTFNQRRAFFIGAAAVIFGVSILSDWFSRMFEKSDMTLLIVISVALSILTSVLLAMGEINFALKAVDAPGSAKLKDLWAPKHFWYFLALTGLLCVLILAGLILLIVPGIILALMSMFAGYILMDENRGPITSIKESFRITKGNRWKLFGFSLAMLGINLLGLLALVVGLLVTVPVTLLATAKVFRVLQAKSPVAEEASGPVPLPTA